MDDHRHRPAEWVRVPVGEQSKMWSTARFERSVLVAARTLTITLWGLDFLDEVLADSRVQMLFSVDDEKPSAYWRSAASLLQRVDAATIPWSQATSMTFDLAVSFSFSGSLDRLRCPLMLGLHGASLGKYGALPSGGRFPLPRLPEARDDTTPTTVVIPHPDERARYGDIGPGVEFAVAGDPCLDRLLASVPRRNHYRRALGVGSDQRLVAVSSTWGRDALLATTPDIATLLTGALPADEYRVALIIHPNIWTGHSGWQVRTWLKRARDAGVLAIAPWTNAWRSALVASDVVVHDHGSVALYAAALGKPLIAVPVESDNLIRDSLTAELGRRAPTLDANRPLRPQIDAAMAGHDPGSYQDIADRVSSYPGESLRLHRDLIYRLMRLEAPTVQPRVLAVDLPPEPLPTPYSHHVCTTVESGDRVVLQRFPAVTPPPPDPRPIAGADSRPQHHIVSDTFEPDTRIPPNAAIIVESVGVDAPEALLDRYPGCRYAVTRGHVGTRLRHRDGSSFRLEARSRDADDPSVAASALYALEIAGRRISNGIDLTVDLGRRTHLWTVLPEP